MLRSHQVLPPGTFEPADSVTLDHDGRHRRRIALTGEKGTPFLLDLPEAVALQDGEGLKLEDGRVVLVRAAPEPLMEVTAPDRRALMRLVWHIGNRHLPAEIGLDHVRLRPDHVIQAMIEGLGGAVRHIEAPFRPEHGAYHRATGHSHNHDHDHDHTHGHRHPGGHAHEH